SNTVGDQETKAGPSHESKSNLETEDSSNLRGSLSKKISILQSKVFETIAADSKVEHSSVRTSKKIGGNKKDEGIVQNQLLTKGTEENDASENKGNSFQSQSNTVGDQETKAGPSHESKSNLETEDSSNLRGSYTKKFLYFKVKSLETITADSKSQIFLTPPPYLAIPFQLIETPIPSSPKTSNIN
ncbi:hypothetical protein TNIN_292671, partial [Trichonephila inaurata madagascariensis]